MEIYRFAVSFLIFLVFLPGFSQNTNRTFESYTFINDTLTLKVNDGEYKIVYYSPEIVETSFISSTEKFNNESFVVMHKPEKVELMVLETESTLTINSEGIEISISKKPFQIRYFFNDEEVISERGGYTKGKEYQKIEFNITGEEMLFGGDARPAGMSRRGNRLELNNRSHLDNEKRSELMNYTLPVVFSSEKYLLHFDNSPIGVLDLDSKEDNTLSYETINGRKTYQLVVGDSWDKIMENYTGLIGRQPMPPRWALGNVLNSFDYHSQKEVLETIQKLRKDSIPVDAMIIDLSRFGKEERGTMGNLEFYRDSFPELKKMITELENQGVKTILVTEPFVLTTSNRWNEAVEQKILATDEKGKPFTFDSPFGSTGLIDIFNPETKEWFWNIYKDLTEMGIAGWWGDFSEYNVPFSILRYISGSSDEMYNVYGHEWAKMVYEGYREDFPEQRPFILMRGGGAGSQKYGLIPWTGDVNRTWGGLKSQAEITLQMGIQGLGYMHSDLGGFEGDNRDDELYLRWLQYGVFQPVYRPHAREEVPSEPVFWPAATKALAKKAIELRYQLLPYNYTLAYQNSISGLPLMRPLFFEQPDSLNLYEVADTYLWGKDILVSPVMSSGLKEKSVIFPSGSNWFDAYSGKKYSGGTTQNIPVVEEHIPTFVRGGAFIPMAKPFQTTASYTGETLEVHYYFDEDIKESAGMLYHDDGKNPLALEEKKYEIIHFSSSMEPGTLNIKVEKEEGGEASDNIQLIEVIIENLKKPVDVVWVNTLRFTAKNYMHNGKLVIPVRFDTSNVTTIKLEFQ